MRRRESPGWFLVFASGVLTYFVFKILRVLIPETTLQIGALGAGNLLLGIAFARSAYLALKQGSMASWQSRVGLMLWSLGYIVGYGVFILNPDSVEVSTLIMLRSLSPFLAVEFARRLVPGKTESGWDRRDGPPAVVLIMILIYRSMGAGIQLEAKIWAIFGIVFVASAVSQAGARVLAVESRGHVASAANAFLSGAGLLLMYVGLQRGSHGTHAGLSLATTAAVTGVLPIAIVTIQICYLKGLNRSSDSSAAFANSAALSLGILFDALAAGNGLRDVFGLIIALSYVVAAHLVAKGISAWPRADGEGRFERGLNTGAPSPSSLENLPVFFV